MPSFIKVRCKLVNDMEPLTCQVLQRNVCDGVSLATPPGSHFFVKIGKFGIPHFQFATDSYKSSHIYYCTKFGMIN